MTDLRQAAQQALDALEHADKDDFWREQRDAITALKAALEQQQAEPSMWGSGDGYWILAEDKPARPDKELFNIPFYTAQPQRNPLTMQPIVQDKRGVFRFKRNGLVDALYEHGVKTGLSLNELHCMDFTDEDRQQFAQLIGYSVSGYGSLSYVSDEAYEAAEQAAHGIKEGT